MDACLKYNCVLLTWTMIELQESKTQTEPEMSIDRALESKMAYGPPANSAGCGPFVLTALPDFATASEIVTTPKHKSIRRK